MHLFSRLVKATLKIGGCFFILGWLSFCGAGLAQDPPHAEVLYISGEPEVCYSEEKEYIKAEEGMYLESGDKIRTDANSYLGLGFDEEEKNIVKVDSNSSVVLILKGNEKIELLKGRVFATINDLPAGSSFEIRTPAAITGVRGTDWVVSVEDDSTDVEAIEGTPYVKSFEEDGKPTDEETIVSTGYETTIKRFRRPLPLRKIPLRRLKGRQTIKLEMIRRAQATKIRRRAIPRRRRIRRPIIRRRINRRRFP